MKKVFMPIALALVLALSVVGCGTQAASSNQKAQKTIVFVNPIVGHPVYAMEEEGLKRAAKDLGFKAEMVGPSSINADAMVNEIETAIAEKVDGIVTVPFNWSAFEHVYAKAKQANIPIVNTGADTPKEWRLSFIGTDTKAYGVQAADILAKKKNGKANILIMMSQLDVQNQVETKDAFEQRLKEKYPNMKVVDVEADKADMVTAVQKFQEVFKAHPEIDTVFEIEATGGNAAAKVVQENGLQSKITILAVDAMPETIDNIKNGLIWGTMAQNFYMQGYDAGKFLMDHFAGKQVPSVLDSGIVLITKDNVNNYGKDMWSFLKK